MSRLRSMLAREEGSAVATAIVVIFVLMLFGFALLADTDAQQRASRVDREHESNFQFAEGVLGAQVFQLSTRWPGGADAPYPPRCTGGAGGAVDCPSNAALTAGFQSVDYKGDKTLKWTTHVRDNGGAAARFYTDAVLTSQPAWDANGDNFLWIRAQGIVRGHKRTLVALVRAEDVTISFPRAAMVAGKYFTSNSGNKEIIYTTGSGQSGAVIVRCSNITWPGKNNTTGCADRWDGQGNSQVSPDTTRSNPSQPDAITRESLELLRQRADADGNLHRNGPSDCGKSLAGDKPGEVVYFDNIGNCTYNSNTVYNTTAKPGILVIARGILTLAGTTSYKGLIYHPNLDASSEYLIRLLGCNEVVGAIVVDGNGGVDAGSCKGNLQYDPNVFNNLKTFGTAGIVQNSFREVAGAQ